MPPDLTCETRSCAFSGAFKSPWEIPRNSPKRVQTSAHVSVCTQSPKMSGTFGSFLTESQPLRPNPLPPSHPFLLLVPGGTHRRA